MTYIDRLAGVRAFFGVSLFVLCFQANSACPEFPKLDGVISIDSCDGNTQTCVPATQALFEYAANGEDEEEVLSIALHASPWRLYEGDMHILPVEDAAALIKPLINEKMKSVHIVASWSGVIPERQGKPLSQRLSEQLNGFPVTGMDGFLWLDKDGGMHTTHQAFTIRKGTGPYNIVAGSKVMASLAVGWPAFIEDEVIRAKDAEWVMRAGVGWDIFFLCPERALKLFDIAAKLGHPVAAYNAAMMRVERRGLGDMEVAKKLLAQSAAAGDEKAKKQLMKLGKR